ncbi:hypothetical protein [Deefgea rivuli]|uniref:hypothetical protein n=1 Tax=Deefgea rivuli TaxID=400948 RepID=UPI0004897F19|nr:hypothetical protein [Deefgea rivuli]
MLELPKIDHALEEAASKTCFFTEGEFEGRKVRVSRANYLALLSMRGAEIPAEVERLRSLFKEVPEKTLEADLISLLAALNWRYHNIACVFIALGFSSSHILEALWMRIKEGSWVSPQLAATAALVDPNFKVKASELVLSSSTHYKSTVSLAELLRTQHKARFLWGTARSNILAAKKQDRDNSGAIALGWLESLQNAIA